MRPALPFLLLAGIVCALLQVAALATRKITPAHPEAAFAATGSFTPDGQYPGAPFARADGVRKWGSWSGGDENTGGFTLGPFPAPRVLRFGASGYPGDPNNALAVERADTGERHPIRWATIGERWEIVDVVLPAAWAGHPIRLTGSDQARGIGGWFAVSEPVRGGRGDGNHALLESLAAWALNGLLLGVLYLAAHRLLAGRPGLAPAWVPLGAAALVAVAGYVAFWVYFANALAGVIFSWITLGTAAWFALRGATAERNVTPDAAAGAAETAAVLRLMLLVGAFHLGVLHLFPTPHDFYTLAANRFREAMPNDNQLPHGVGERLFASEPPKNPADEWRSSDRPPLQTGWQLLTWPAGKLLDLDRRSVSGTSAVWFQLLWVAAAHALFRTFGLNRRRAAGWVAACALAGFFVQNTTYTWPKLAAGAFALGAFAMLLLPAGSMTARARGGWAALFAALGWLAHGGVAFSYLPLLPWVAWRACRGEWRAWLPGAALCLALMLPWIAYQKFYDPPGDMLLKLHLAGQQKPDGRGLLQTLRENYAQLGASEAWANKVSNFHAQVFGRWSFLLDGSAATKVERRNEEFFHAGRGLTWWPLLALLAVAVARRRGFTSARDLAVFALWLVATVIVWCLLLFGQYQAVIHHGSYALMIGWFVLCSVLLDRSGRGWLALLALLQAVTFATTWAVPNPVVFGPPTGLFFVLATAALLGWTVIRALARDPAADSPAGPAAGARASGADNRWERTADALRAWWARPRLTAWVLLALAALLALRKPHALHTPQLWAEDGSIFLMQADLHGAAALALPYMGYLHLLPRLIAGFASQVLDPAWWPAFYNGVAFVLWVAVLARFFTARFQLPGKPWLAFAFVAVAHSGEVFFNITNLQWLTGFVLIQQVLITSPVTRGQRAGDLAILAVVALTGPFSLAFLPLFAWRAWRERSRPAFAALAVTGLGAAVQAWLVLSTGPRFDYQAEAFRLWPFLEVLARRVVVWPLLGRDAATTLPPAVVTTLGGAVLAAAVAWVLRPHERRMLRLQTLAACGLITLAGAYRARSDLWPADNLDFSDRYFYVPRVLLAWLLVWEFDARPRAAAVLARAACLAGVVANLPDYTLRAPTDYQWAKHVAPIRQGVPANIPILPENWTLDYRGRPRAD